MAVDRTKAAGIGAKTSAAEAEPPQNLGKSVKTGQDLVEVLFLTVERANAGVADIAQATLVCKATSTLINLAKLKMEHDKSKGHVPWLEVSDRPSQEKMTDRLTAILDQIAIVSRKLEDSTTSEPEKARFRAMLNGLVQEQRMIEYSLAKT
jgi:hypothetical protein